MRFFLLLSHRILDVDVIHFIASLCCADADEAKTLIPSIAAKMSDEDLDAVLDQINKLRSTSE